MSRYFIFSHSDFDNAIAMYDRIIATTQSPEKKLQAEENKKTVLEALHAR